MPGIVSRRADCRLCSGKDLKLVLPLTPAPIIDDYVPPERVNEVQDTYPMDIYLCDNCGHSQLIDVVDPQVLYGNYIYETTSSPGLVAHFEAYAKAVLDKVNPPKGSLAIDIGSNDGSLLEFFRRRGMKVMGVDPAVEIAAKATGAGIKTLPIFFTTDASQGIRNEWGPAAIVTANNLFANVDDLDDLIQGIRCLLDSDGVFIFETFYMVDLIQNMVFDFLYHEHLNCFSVKPLAAFFARHGMELIDVERVPTKGGSIRSTVQLSGGTRTVSPSVSTFIKDEETLGIHSPELFNDFSTRIDRAKTQLVQLIRQLMDQGKTIAGYGASATTTTQIYHFGIGDTLEFIVDDNPAKQGLFSPGLHIPVLPAQVIYERLPDYVLILAWRFADDIIKKHQAFLDQGGRFIVPLPKMRII